MTTAELTAYERGARDMRNACRNVLNRYSREAQERGNHVEAQHCAYYAGKLWELPYDAALLARLVGTDE